MPIRWLAIGIETVIHMIVDQFALGICDSLLNNLELLGHVEARFAYLDHLDNGA